MKTILLPLLFICFFATAQTKIEKYYDYNWKECKRDTAMYYSIAILKDSLWQCKDYYINEQSLQMQGFYKDTALTVEHGMFVYYHRNRMPMQTGIFISGAKQGSWLSFHTNGIIKDSVFYVNDKQTGYSLGWDKEGNQVDSVHFDNVENKITFVKWWPNGNPAMAGITINAKKHGAWQYFYNTGKLSLNEVFENGQLKSRNYYTEDGSLISDTAKTDKKASFPGGIKAWRAFVENKLLQSAYVYTGSGKIRVTVIFTINEEGRIIDVQVAAPNNKELDNVAMDIIKRSPKWTPAKMHGRNVSEEQQQQMIFQGVQ